MRSFDIDQTTYSSWGHNLTQKSLLDVEKEDFPKQLGLHILNLLYTSDKRNFGIYGLCLASLGPQYDEKVWARLNALSEDQLRVVSLFVKLAADMGDNAAQSAWTLLWSDLRSGDKAMLTQGLDILIRERG